MEVMLIMLMMEANTYVRYYYLLCSLYGEE